MAGGRRPLSKLGAPELDDLCATLTGEADLVRACVDAVRAAGGDHNVLVRSTMGGLVAAL
jgi:hypothetical protein